LRVPRSGQRQAHYNLIRVERRNGSRCEPHPSVGEVSQEHCSTRASVCPRASPRKWSGATGIFAQSWKPRARKGGPANGQSGCEVGGIKGATRRTGLEDCKWVMTRWRG